jgi:REP element-mobilizing transposase RayT
MPTEEQLRIYLNRLPHWRLAGSTYFVTWRVADGISDLSYAERDFVQQCLLMHHRQRYQLYGYVVMNDHVHALLRPLEGFELSGTLQLWKSGSGRLINRARGGSGTLWQKDSFNRIMRSEAEVLEKMQYMLNNPRKRWPEIVDYKWAAWFTLEG